MIMWINSPQSILNFYTSIIRPVLLAQSGLTLAKLYLVAYASAKKGELS